MSEINSLAGLPLESGAPSPTLAEGPATPSGRVEYRGFIIEHNPPPIPVRCCDWQFWHEDYDGAEDSRDNRCGSAGSLDDAKLEIDMILEDWS